MNGILTALAIILGLLIVVLVPVLVAPSYVAVFGPVTVFDSSRAVLLCGGLALVAGLWIHKSGPDGPFLVKLFILALLIRMFIGAAIFIFNGQQFFGGDAFAYDFYGSLQAKGWAGDRYARSFAIDYLGEGTTPGWGMIYLVAVLYTVLGRNMLAVQFFNSVLGAATAPIIFLCSQHIFSNTRVARISAFAVAFFPSLVLWSAQGLKDGLIVFCLALAILATLKLGEKFSLLYLALLVGALFSILSLRFYVFYMILMAVGGAFLIGTQNVTTKSFVRRFVVMIILGLALTYLGVTRSGNLQFERYGSLQHVQNSRLDQSSAGSGFGKDVDVSTTAGALSTIPLGLLYLLFAPFPWQLANLRQFITLPEMIAWWGSFPMLVLGLWFSIRYRLRQISPILIFTVMLSLAYSVFQGNVGTAYRQRAQILVFYFIFVAVGYVLLLEKHEEKKLQELREREVSAARTDATLPPGSPVRAD